MPHWLKFSEFSVDFRDPHWFKFRVQRLGLEIIRLKSLWVIFACFLFKECTIVSVKYGVQKRLSPAVAKSRWQSGRIRPSSASAGVTNRSCLDSFLWQAHNWHDDSDCVTHVNCDIFARIARSWPRRRRSNATILFYAKRPFYSCL